MLFEESTVTVNGEITDDSGNPLVSVGVIGGAVVVGDDDVPSVVDSVGVVIGLLVNDTGL